MTIQESKILPRWKSASNYMGEDLSDYYVLTSFSRDSNVYPVANFIGIARRLTSLEPESDNGWRIVQFGHWGCGYIYSILIHVFSPLVAEAETIAKVLRDYSIYDDGVLCECEALIEEAIQQYASVSVDDDDDEDEDEDAYWNETQELIDEVFAAQYCESLLAPFNAN